MIGRAVTILALSILVSAILIGQEKDPFQNLYFINSGEFFDLADQKPTEFHLIYTYAYWCKPCREISPKVFEFVKSNPSLNFYPLLVEKHGSDYIERNLRTMKEKYDFEGNVFMPDLEYGKKYLKRYEALINELAPGHQNFGYSLILLFKGKELVFASNWEMTIDEKIQSLTALIPPSSN